MLQCSSLLAVAPLFTTSLTACRVVRPLGVMPGRETAAAVAIDGGEGIIGVQRPRLCSARRKNSFEHEAENDGVCGVASRPTFRPTNWNLSHATRFAFYVSSVSSISDRVVHVARHRALLPTIDRLRTAPSNVRLVTLPSALKLVSLV